MQSHALNVLNSKKGKSKKLRDKHSAAASADQSGSGAAALVSDVSDGTEEGEGVTQEPGDADGAVSLAAEAGVEGKEA